MVFNDRHFLPHLSVCIMYEYVCLIVCVCVCVCLYVCVCVCMCVCRCVDIAPYHVLLTVCIEWYSILVRQVWESDIKVCRICGALTDLEIVRNGIENGGKNCEKGSRHLIIFVFYTIIPLTI